MEKLIEKVFFYGDYLADRTASGKEESGIRTSRPYQRRNRRIA